MKQRIRAVREYISRHIRRLVSWWHRKDRQYRPWWRIGNGVAACVVVVSFAMPTVLLWINSSRYDLSAGALHLVGPTQTSLTKQLTYDAKKASYLFNSAAIQDYNPLAQIQAKIGTAGGGKDKSLYALDVPTDIKKGVTYHDVNSQLSFTLTPKFQGLEGKLVQGHLVFPLSGNTQAVYTLKGNGLKEDIVVDKATDDTMSFSYTLNLPKSLTARLLDNGGVGIYGPDPSLLGNVSAADAKDQALLQKARENAAKNYLIFGLPAPVITTQNGKALEANAHFELKGNILTVVAKGLDSIKGAFSIDPSVVVTSASDFASGSNNEGNIDFSTSGQITRGGLTGGSVGTWAATTALPHFIEQHATAVYNGRLYVMGGLDKQDSDYNPYVYMATLNTDGTLGSWSNIDYVGGWASGNATFVAGRAVIYNGYLYLIGGNSNYGSGSTKRAVAYAPINPSDGTLGTWQTGPSLSQDYAGFAAAVYNGYIYVMGGSAASGTPPYYNSVYYAAINADGSLGSWTTTSTLLDSIGYAEGVAYNGYLYFIGGANSSGFVKTVEYAPINSDGTLGTWQQTSTIITAQYGGIAYTYNGYMYYVGGWTSKDSTYAQINANGTLGTWLATSNLDSAGGNRYAGGVAYNGYVYDVGGRESTSGNTVSEVQYAKIDPAGQLTSFGTLANNLSAARTNVCSVAYNGYLYAIGGSTSNNFDNNVTTVQYTALNATTGNNGSWSSTTALPVARGSAGCAVYNGRLYVLGGQTGSGTGTASASVLYIGINSNGSLAGSWTTSGNSLPNSYGFRPGVFTYGTSGGMYLYVLGGCATGGNATCDDTNYAPLNASTGAVGTWTTSTGVDMPDDNQRRGYAQVGKYLYAFGGSLTSSSAYADVAYTSINDDGTINAWTTTMSMNSASTYTGGTTVNGCIYSVGGRDATTSISSVQYACPDANGSISVWNNAPNLTVATAGLGVTSYNGYMYGVGGYTSSVQATTQFAAVNNGGSGSNGAWAATTNSLATGVNYGASTNYNGYAYVVGGATASGTPVNSVQYSQAGANGDLGAFTTDAHTFTTARNAAGTVAYGGYLYVVGGQNQGGGTLYGDVQYAPIGTNGGLSGNFASTTSFVTGTGGDTGRESPCVVAYNGYIYAIGGWTGTTDRNDVRYAAISSNGSLGSWADSGNNFTGGRSDMGCFVANGYLYILGGDGATLYNDVQYALINSNGTLGVWNYTTSFTGARKLAVVTYNNGFVYVAGGCTISACTSPWYGDTQYAPVYANGAVGTWQRSTNTFNGYTRGTTTGVAMNGYLYLLGGDGSVARSDVVYAPLNAISRTGRYSKLIDLGTPVNVTSVTYNGTVPGGSGAITYQAAGSNGVFGSSAATSAISGTGGCYDTATRYLFITVSLDDSYGQGTGGIFPDANGTNANLTDLTVNYLPVHPSPDIRLRHGQTLQQGTLSGLDTCS